MILSTLLLKIKNSSGVPLANGSMDKVCSGEESSDGLDLILKEIRSSLRTSFLTGRWYGIAGLMMSFLDLLDDLVVLILVLLFAVIVQGGVL